MIKEMFTKKNKSEEKIESEVYEGFPSAKDCLKKTENTIDEKQANYYNTEYDLIDKNRDKIIKLINSRIAEGKSSCTIKFKKATSEFGLEKIQKRVIYESIIKEFKDKGFNCSLSTDQRFNLNGNVEYDFIKRKSDEFISVKLDWSNGIGDFKDSDIVSAVHHMMLHSIGYRRNHYSFRDCYEKEFKDIYGE